jgi:hypothetical protein
MRNIQGLPPTFPLDSTNMNALWKEVEAYWSNKDMRLDRSIFTIED